MELVLQSNPMIKWQFIAAKKLEAPKNIGEFIVRIPAILSATIDQLRFEMIFQCSWFLRRLIF